MQITGEYTLKASRSTVWNAIHDDAVLMQCIPGCKSIERISSEELRSVVTTKIGPVSATFKGVITFSDEVPLESLCLAGAGDGGIVGFAKGRARVLLSEVENGTHLKYEVDVLIGGKIAQIGQRLIVGTARKTSDMFFGNLVAYFNQDEVSATN